MKLLYLFCTAESSIAIVTLNQIKALRLYYPEVNIEIACVNYYPERSVLEGELVKKRIRKKRVITNMIDSLLFVHRTKNRFKPDITISNISSINAFNVLVSKNDKKIGIFHAPNIQFSVKSYWTRLLNELSLLFIFKRLDVVVGISQEIVNDLEVNISCSNVSLQYNIHDVNLVREKSGAELSIDVGKKNKFEIVCLGTIDRNKCQDLLIKSLIMSEEDYHLYIVGKIIDDEYYNELVSLIKEADIENKVSFIPFLANPYPLLNRVDLLVSTSISEGLPGVVIESLLLNTPVVCSDSSLGIWEILSCEKEKDVIEEVVRTQKGLIIPNPNSISEEKYVRLLSDAIMIVKEEYKLFKESDFEFEKKISFESVHSFYNMLVDLRNENIS